jgi:hypothetical protein
MSSRTPGWLHDLALDGNTCCHVTVFSKLSLAYRAERPACYMLVLLPWRWLYYAISFKAVPSHTALLSDVNIPGIRTCRYTVGYPSKAVPSHTALLSDVNIPGIRTGCYTVRYPSRQFPHTRGYCKMSTSLASELAAILWDIPQGSSLTHGATVRCQHPWHPNWLLYYAISLKAVPSHTALLSDVDIPGIRTGCYTVRYPSKAVPSHTEANRLVRRWGSHIVKTI